MGQRNIKKPFEFHNFRKIFYWAWPGSGKRVWVFLCNVNTQEPF